MQGGLACLPVEGGQDIALSRMGTVQETFVAAAAPGRIGALQALRNELAIFLG
jgi:hypothetical protein